MREVHSTLCDNSRISHALHLNGEGRSVTIEQALFLEETRHLSPQRASQGF